MAEATTIAPERLASAFPTPANEHISGAPTPNIIVWDDGQTQRPQSPETLIPATDTLSTRPTRGGVAYPFRLKVEGKDTDVNASTLTLQSIAIATPGVEGFQEEGGILGSRSDMVESDEEATWPTVERSVTADAGDLITRTGEKGAEDGQDQRASDGVRPGVERFETAQEDLSMVANGKT
jgi:hypothetical protein